MKSVSLPIVTLIVFLAPALSWAQSTTADSWQSVVYSHRDENSRMCCLRVDEALLRRSNESRSFEFVALWRYNSEKKAWGVVDFDAPEPTGLEPLDAKTSAPAFDRTVVNLTDRVGLYCAEWLEDGRRTWTLVLSAPLAVADLEMGDPPDGYLAAHVPDADQLQATFVPDPEIHCHRDPVLIPGPSGILVVLAGIAALFFYLEKRTNWKLFHFFPPLLFIYALPMLLSNTATIFRLALPDDYCFDVIPNEGPLFEQMGLIVMPMFLILMLLDVDVLAAVRIMGRGIVVLLFGTAGVVVGAPIAFWLVKNGLGPEAWKGYGALAGSWIGGTGNMAAVSEGLGTPGAVYGLAALADVSVYMLWLPILLGSKNCAKWFNRIARVDPKRIEMLERSSDDLSQAKPPLRMRHLLYLIFLGLFFPWVAMFIAEWMPSFLSVNVWKILLITTFGIILSTTPARRIPGSHELAMALVYLFVAQIGAKADLKALDQAFWFVLGAFIWISIHGLFCLAGALLLRVDVHSMAITSAANIGGAASAPIVAAHHNEKLVPVSILMALIGYAIGNYAAFLAAWLCWWVAGRPGG